MKSKALCSIMARQREYSLPLGSNINSSTDWLFYRDDDNDMLTLTSPGEDIWKKFDILTPPDSPSHEFDDCFETDPDPLCSNVVGEDWLTTSLLMADSEKLASNLIQDCMWSGSDEEKARSARIRKVSLSELTMITASTSWVDPTSVSSCPRVQNQLEHSYSLTTPEPLRVPAIMTPSSTDDSESEEDVIDVVTIDTRTNLSSNTPLPQTSIIISDHNKKYQSCSEYKVRDNLNAVAHRLSRDAHKRPKCMTDHDFAMPSSKKIKRYNSLNTRSVSPPSLIGSQNGSDNEEFEGKRSAHNVMERQRRNELKNSLFSLRSCLPSLNTQERAPKVVILAHATDYVKELRKQENHLVAEYRNVKITNSTLKRRLGELQRRAGFTTI